MAKKGKYHVRPDGLHEAIRTINGKRVAFRGKTDREVDRKILEYREAADKGRTFSEVADEWEREHEAKITESSRRVYSNSVERLKEAFRGRRVPDIRPVDIQNHIRRFEAQGRSASSVQVELSVCKMIFSYAVLRGDIDISPAVEVRKSRGLPKKKREALTEEQEALVKAAGIERKAHWWLFAHLLFYTGCRRGEALALTYQDIDRKAGVIHITKKVNYAYTPPKVEHFLKSKNGLRDVPLLPPLADALPKDRIGLIFPGRDGGTMKEAEVASNWRAYCRDVGLVSVETTDDGKTIETFPVTPHCLRHSFSTICYEAGLDPRQAAALMGDTLEVVERVYTHLRNDKRASAADKLTAYLDRTAEG